MFKFNLQEPTPSKSNVFSLACHLMQSDKYKFDSQYPNATYALIAADFLSIARRMIAEQYSQKTLKKTFNKKTNTAIFLA